MVERPLLLLDIDGVLNPWAAPACPEGFSEYTLFPEEDQPVRLAEQHGEWVRDTGVPVGSVPTDSVPAHNEDPGDLGVRR